MTKRAPALLLALLLLPVACPGWALAAEPLERVRDRALLGDARAQFELGVRSMDGAEAPADYTEAFAWFRRAARQGHEGARFLLGFMYQEDPAPRAAGAAAKWHGEEARQDLLFAQRKLARMYQLGHGVPQDNGESLKWYRRVAEQGDPVDQRKLGLMYQVLSQDHAAALPWYRRAAKQGDAEALLQLGHLYRHGRGVSQDLVSAYQWYDLAVAKARDHVREVAAEHRSGLEAAMTPAQIAEARRRSREWQQGPAP